VTTFLAGFTVAGVGFLLIGFAMASAYRRDRNRDNEAWFKTVEFIRATYQSSLDEYEGRLQDEVGRRFIAEATALMEQRQRIAAEREATTHRTALRGELHRQARAELIRPDEPAGVATVLEFTATGRGGRRSK
jgi:hypothetical protein